ncbi:Gti1/Pac2 family-domain-containing protein [Paraphysoderma sedebokerense]|nr:Gti1/Pac2 family-domain-containing protein [Paraphysoderma sedebokerense]
MAQDSTNPVRFETFWGNVEDTVDALLIFQAIQEGKLPKVRRRLVEKERKGIRSGSIFVFDSETGIKRWTDGRLWSPSRIQGNFLVVSVTQYINLRLILTAKSPLSIEK